MREEENLKSLPLQNLSHPHANKKGVGGEKEPLKKHLTFARI